MKFLLSSQAERACEELWDYYARAGGTRLADRVLAEVYDSIQRLIEFLTLGHHRPDLTDKPFRFYRVYDLLLTYDPESSPLYVARIYHGAQDVRLRMMNEPD